MMRMYIMSGPLVVIWLKQDQVFSGSEWIFFIDVIKEQDAIQVVDLVLNDDRNIVS